MKKQLVVSLTLVVVVSAFLLSSSAETDSGGHVLIQNKNDPPPERKLSGEADIGETGSGGGHVLVQNKNDPPPERELTGGGRNDPAPERKLKVDPIPVDFYTKYCSPELGCHYRRRLLANSPLPKVSSHGLQHRLRHQP